MTIWGVASGALLLALVPIALATMRKGALDRLIGMKLAGVVITLASVTIAFAAQRTLYLEVSLAIALLSFVGTMAYAYFLERWL